MGKGSQARNNDHSPRSNECEGNFIEKLTFHHLIIQNNEIKNPILTLILFCFLFLINIGCQPKSPTNQPTQSKLRVAVTTDILADSIKNVCGTNCEITTIVPSTKNPHSYALTEQDKEDLTKADLIISIGFSFESKLTDFLKSLGNKSVTLESIIRRQESEKLSTPNPHFWSEPGTWSKNQSAIAIILIEKSPALKEIITRNQIAYCKELDSLAAEMTQTLNSIPTNNRILVTQHNAFEYLAHQNGIRTISLNQHNLSTVAQEIVTNKVPAIFIESNQDPQKIRELQKAVRAKAWQVRIGGELSADSLGKNTTTFEMMRNNAKIIAAALHQ
ncbi:MAG: metal ABC transporter substrate-binding protein [Fimbriimonadaceae bacterium]